MRALSGRQRTTTGEPRVLRAAAGDAATIAAATAVRTVMAYVFIAALTAVWYAPVLTFWFTGADALPLVLSNRVETVADAGHLFTRDFLSAFDPAQHAGSVTFRPVGAVSFAIDGLVWDLDPAGYHLTDVVLHTITALLVLTFVRTLPVRRPLLAGVIAATAFAIHPLHAATVPLMAARTDLFLGLFLLLCWIGLFRYASSGRSRDLALCLGANALALASKPTAIIALPAIACGALLFVWWQRMTRANAVRAVLGSAATTCGFFAYQRLVVGGLGGYPVSVERPVRGTLAATYRFFRGLVLPSPLTDDPGRIGSANAVVVVAGALALLAVLVAGTIALARPRHTDGSTHGPRAAVERNTAYLLALWIIGFLPMYAGIYVLTGHLKPLYLYPVLALWCSLWSILAVSFLSRGTEPGERAAPLWRGLTWGAIVLSGTYVLARTPPVMRYDAWSTGSAANREYLAAVIRIVDRVPDGASVLLSSVPQRVACDAPCVGNTYLLEPYSVEAWLRLGRPARAVTLRGISSVALPEGGDPPLTEVEQDAAGTLRLRTTGAAVSLPWVATRAAGAPDLVRHGDTTVVTVHPGDEGRGGTGLYLFDPFARPALRRLGDPTH